MNIQNMLHVFKLYNLADILLYADAFIYFFEKIFQLTNLYPSRYLTLASLSMGSLLYNGRVKGKRLFFPYYEEDVYSLISDHCLNGGFSTSSCLYK